MLVFEFILASEIMHIPYAARAPKLPLSRCIPHMTPVPARALRARHHVQEGEIVCAILTHSGLIRLETDQGPYHTAAQEGIDFEFI